MSMKIKKMVRDGATTSSTHTTKISALETAVGDADSGLVKDVADLTALIGDEETANTILARIKALEDAATTTETEQSS